MKVALYLSLAVSAAAFSQDSRREALKGIAAAGVAFLPVAANAAVGESPRFSVFGIIGDGTSYSEGAAYGTDQAAKLYSPYSVYSNEGDGSVFNPSDPELALRKKAILTETKKRLGLLPKYISRKEWFNVIDELNRYMYETRGAVRGLATTPAQKEAAEDFFKAIESTNMAARLRKQEACASAAADSIVKLDAFTAKL